MRRLFMALTALTALAVLTAASSLDRPLRAAWPAASTVWSAEHEDDFAEFVARFGAAVEARRCKRLDACLRDPEANLTYDPAVDARLRLEADCADLPYLLRAYFAFKRRLPFGFVSATRGLGDDLRFAADVTPVAWRSWRDFPTPRAVLRAVGSLVHSGMFRTAADVETGDFYPVRIDRRSVRPGTVFYDPLGHVSLVTRVSDDGDVFLMSGTPEGLITFRQFASWIIVVRRPFVGGFKRFRPLFLDGRRLVRTPNAALLDFDATAQYDSASHIVDDRAVNYLEWVRASLSLSRNEPAPAPPIDDFRLKVRAVCRDVADRAEAVELAARAGIAARPHPRALPPNIYGAHGTWETFATPSRDARLKAAFRDLAVTAGAILDELPGLAADLQVAWADETQSPACQFVYLGSDKLPVPFTLDTVLDRLFDLSFDPFHCPELRWGAPAGSAELAACPDGADKRAFYEAERRLRNRIDRADGAATPLDAGPDEPPDIDLRPLLAAPTWTL